MQQLPAGAVRAFRRSAPSALQTSKRSASTFHHDSHAATRTIYRWLATGLIVPFGLAYALEKSIPHDRDDLKHVIDDQIQRQSNLYEQPVDDLHHTSGPLAEDTLKDTVAVKMLNEQAKMWTSLWGMVGEAPCSFPVI